MRVLEIGCGTRPGPRFDNAESYFILDVDKNKVDDAAASLEGKCSPIVGSAEAVPMPDASLDIILARNVFSDPDLAIHGLGTTETGVYHLARLLKGGGSPQHLRHGIAEASDELKDSFLTEAGRLLVAGGKLVSVDHGSYHISDRYFRSRQPEAEDRFGLHIEEAELVQAVAANYAAAHGRNMPKVWTATKA